MKKILLLLLLVSFHSLGQDFSEYHWKNRIIAVFSNTFDCHEANEQLALLKENLEGLKERKLKVFHVTTKEFRKDFSEETENCSEKINVNRNFMVVLVGLDGYPKFTEYSPQTAETFFNLIDQMPMRLAEIKKRKGTN